MRDRCYIWLGLSLAGVFCIAVFSAPLAPLLAQTAGDVLEGQAAFGDWRADRPGLRRLIKPQDLPPPQVSQSVANWVRVARTAPMRRRAFPLALSWTCSLPAWRARA
jgi:hypothetical protein